MTAANRAANPDRGVTMPKYMLLMYQPVERPPVEDWAAEHAKWARYHEDLSAAGLLVANDGLSGPESATTVRMRDGEAQVTDGPYAETKEYLAGYFLIDAPELDTALAWAGRIPSATYGAVEVRPVWGAA
jgi:hypothetical protein